MSLLYPWLLAGLAAIGVPLWLHLRARTGPAIPFSAVRFLEDQPRPRIRGLKLRDILLFLARAAAVCLLAAAFAWPFRHLAGPAVTESRVYLLDNTLSRQAEGAMADRDAIRDAVRGAPAGVQVAVVELTSRARVVSGFGDEREQAAQALQALAPSFQRGSYLEAFRLAEALLAQSLGRERKIVVYGDGQENQWSENESTPPFLRDVQVEVARRPGRAERENLSLGDPLSRRFFLGEESKVELSARLRHPSRGKATVVLEADGVRVFREEVALDGKPEVLTLHGEWPADPTRWVRGQVWIENASDALAADDRVYFTVPPVREGRVALLARSPYLRAALSPEIVRGRWAASALDAASDLGAVAEKDLADVLVLEGDYAQSEQVRTLAFRYLNNGRGVLLVAGRTTPLLGGFVRELGFELAGQGEKEEGLRFVAGDHPVFKPFAGGELGDLAEPRVFRHLRLRPLQGVPLAFGESGDGLVFEGGATRGRLLVLPFALDRTQTDWPLRASFIPFLDLALQHVRAEARVETSAEPGPPVLHELPTGREVLEVVLSDESGRPVGRAPVGEDRRARLPGPERPGFYALTYDGAREPEVVLAVNPSTKESVLRYVADPAALRAWVVPPASRASEPVAVALTRASSRAALEQRWWWWLLWAAALALVVESLQLVFRRERTG
jgi:hypothetical protein